MSLEAKLIDRLWNSEYGDTLFKQVIGEQGPTNIRSMGTTVVEITASEHLREGLYHLVHDDKFNAERLEVYSFESVPNLGIVSHKLDTLLKDGKPKTNHRSIRVDPTTLTKSQIASLESIFKYPVFSEEWTITVQATKTNTVNDFHINVKDFNKCFTLTRPSDDHDEEEETTKDVFLVVLNGERGFISYNLSELLFNDIIEADEVLDLVRAIIEHQQIKSSDLSRDYIRASETARLRSSIVSDAKHRMRHNNLIDHAAQVLARHNPNFKVSGDGADYINCDVFETKGELPYLAEYLPPLWRLSIPGLEAVTANSMRKEEAFKTLVDSFFLETRIKPLGDEEVRLLQNYQFPRKGTVEYGLFTYSIKKERH